MRGCLSWLSGVIDNAIYPVLFAGACIRRKWNGEARTLAGWRLHHPRPGPNHANHHPSPTPTTTTSPPNFLKFLPTTPPDYLASLYPHLADPAPRALLVLSFALAFSYMAWRGLDVAGKLAIGICAACLLPFVALW